MDHLIDRAVRGECDEAMARAVCAYTRTQQGRELVAGWVPAIVESLRARDPRAAEALFNLSSLGKEVCSAIEAEGALPLLVADGGASAIGAIGNIAIHGPVADCPGLVALVVAAMGSSAPRAASALSSITSRHGVAAVEEHGAAAASALIAALADDEACASAASALANLAAAGNASGIMAALAPLRALSLPGRPPRGRRQAARCAMSLTAHAGNCAEVLREFPLLRLLDDEDPAVATHAVHAVYNIACADEGCRKALARGGAVESLVRLLAGPACRPAARALFIVTHEASARQRLAAVESWAESVLAAEDPEDAMTRPASSPTWRGTRVTGRRRRPRLPPRSRGWRRAGVSRLCAPRPRSQTRRPSWTRCLRCCGS